VRRYAITTTGATGGVVTVRASTSDPAGTIRINGRLAPDGNATLEGLTDGDEISVFITDSSGTRAYALMYLPAGFPELEVVEKQPGVMPGRVGLTISQWNQSGSPNFEVALDQNAVPVHVWSTNKGTLDLKRQPNGSYSVSRPTESEGRTGSAVVELDTTFREIRRHETVDLLDTDGHDSLLQPDGSRILIGYEPNSLTGKVDATIQEVDPQGEVVFTWNSKDHVDLDLDPVVPDTNPDYAHINSVVIMDDGDILASFRHLSQVLKIAWSDHDGFQRGDIVWRLGGRRSDFTFSGDPYPSGPCAQHTASQLPSGNILIFDNGSGGFFNSMCVDPADPGGPTVSRTQTRITEYDVDATSGTATLVWQYLVPGRYAGFAGSAERLPNGNTMIGWAAARAAMATEVSPEGEVLWEIRDAAAATEPPSRPVYFTYRALKFAVPDAIKPTVSLVRPRAGATYTSGQRVRADFTCTDRGGSTLRSCGGTSRPGGLLDTSTPGTHTFTARATDGAGNVARVTRTYSVTPRYQPDLVIRKGQRAWVGSDVYGSFLDQRVRQQIRRDGRIVRATVRLDNDGLRTDRFAVTGVGGGKKFRVSYFRGTENVTGRVVAGTWRTRWLRPDEAVRLRVVVRRLRSADPGDEIVTRVRAVSGARPRFGDAVATVVRATR
jgi:hypothetical protein